MSIDRIGLASLFSGGTGFARPQKSSFVSTPSIKSNLLSGSSEGNSFLVKLEKHIGDVRHGKGYLSSDISAKLLDKDAQNGTLLGSSNAKAFSYYLGISSALGYGSRARFINNINESVKNLSQITEPPKSFEDTAEQIKKIYGQQVYSQIKSNQEAIVQSETGTTQTGEKASV